MKVYTTISVGPVAVTKAIDLCHLPAHLRSAARTIKERGTNGPIPHLSIGKVVRQSRRSGRVIEIEKPGPVVDEWIDACVDAFHEACTA